MTTREADDEEPAPEPQPASSPPAATVPAINLSAPRRDMGRRQGEISLGWNTISINLLSGRPLGHPLPTPRPRTPPARSPPLPYGSACRGRSPTAGPPRPDTSR